MEDKIYLVVQKLSDLAEIWVLRDFAEARFGRSENLPKCKITTFGSTYISPARG